ncbi:MAG: T9SS type A sorting domain-containing protein [Saprospiraceae bacterium]
MVDANGCSSTDSFTIPLLEVPDVVLSQEGDLCIDGQVVLTVNTFNSAAYIWSTGDSSPSIIATSSGLYTVTVENEVGCSAEQTYELTDNSISVFASITTIDCDGSLAAIELEGIGGSGTYTFDWFDLPGEDNPQNRTGLPPGTYQVTVSDGTCQSVEVYTIEPSPEFPPVILTGTAVACNNQSGFIQVVNPLSGWSFAWNNGSTSPVLQGLAWGTYCVIVVNENGCIQEACFTITGPTLQGTVSGVPQEYCPGDFTLEATVDEGLPPFTFNWTQNGAVLATGAAFTNPPDGEFLLRITDGQNCTINVPVTVDAQPDAIIHSTGYLNCSTGTALLDGSASTSEGFLYEWTGPSGVLGANDPIVEVNEAGEYTLRVVKTDDEDCVAVTTMTIVDPQMDFGDGIAVTLQNCNQYQLSGIVPPNYFGSISFLWTYPDGSVSNEGVIPANQTGVYTLATEATGLDCTFYSTVFIDLEAVACATIQGYIRVDDNEDCVANPDEWGVAGIVVTANNGVQTWNTLTNAAGAFSFNLPVGSYSITYTLPSASWDYCQSSYVVDVFGNGEVANLEIPIQRIADCPELEVTLSSFFLRRCFSSTYYIRVENIGTVVADQPLVTLMLDEYLTYENAYITPFEVNGQAISWLLDDLAPGAVAYFSVQVLVSCDATLGQTHCSEVFATPDILCAPAPGWSGANVELDARCEDNEAIFTVANNGTNDLDQPLYFIVIEDGVAMMQGVDSIQILPAGQETSFSFPANGSTYTFQIDQVANHPYSELLSVSLEGCGTNAQGEFSTGIVNQFSQNTSTLANDVLCMENTGAYDPNDKTALPVGYQDAHYIVPETEISYRIRFQNTGTDTAFTVIILDTLSEWLDIRSLRIGNSSHAFTADIRDERVLSFTFNNILLPDSTTNLAASQGFVDFKISPLADAPLATIIENAAAIYFDFNEPVITNTVFHTLGRDFLDVVNLTVAPAFPLAATVFPNPTNQLLQLQIEGNTQPIATIQLVDGWGRTVKTYPFESPHQVIDVSSLPTGSYVIRLLTQQGQLVANGQVIIQQGR